VIDEVHERDLNVDFLLIILKKAIQARKATGKQVPKVILMSATLDTKLFAEYLAEENPEGQTSCPSLSVPGRTFPVTERYLTDIVESITGSHAEEFKALMELDKQVSSAFLAAETTFMRRQTLSTGQTVIDWKRGTKAANQDEAEDGNEKEEGMVPVALLAATIAHICKTSDDDGAVLAFLPGLNEITSTQSLLLQRPIFGVDFQNTSRYNIHVLHSQVAPAEQSLVLKRPPAGCRKIILSTNIAETSITVPDIKHVVDTGKLRESRYDQVRRITKLQTVWESKSNARQRAGRAGRVQEGNYYALYTRERREAMPAAGLAELLRSDLQSVCLSIKAQGFQESVSMFLSQAIEPPPQRGIDAAVANLKAIEAFTADEQLTALGRVLSTLPVHPTLGKMIILGIIFKCLHPMLVLGSMDGERSLFNQPPGARDAAAAAQRVFDKHESDHLAFLAAFDVLREAKETSGKHRAVDIAQSHFLSMGAFETINSTAQQILQLLVGAGLVPAEHGSQFGGPSMNVNADNAMLIKCLLLAGTYPNIGVKGYGKTVIHRTADADVVLMHPRSVNHVRKEESDRDRIYAFATLARNVSGTRLFMRDSTAITPLMVLLFGGALEIQGTKLTMDGWLPVRFWSSRDVSYVSKLVLEFRKGLDRVLNNAFKSLSKADGRSLVNDEVRDLFTSNVAEMMRLQDPDASPAEQNAPRLPNQIVPSGSQGTSRLQDNVASGNS
jgi:HrpA-like RNA helicase